MTLFWTLSIIGAILAASGYTLVVVMLRWGEESRAEEHQAQMAAAVRAYDQIEREAEWRSR